MKLIASFLLCLPLAVSAQTLLTKNKFQSFKLTQGDVKSFVINLEKGKTYQVIVEQRGIDVDLRLKNQAGKEVAYKDSPNGKYGPEIIELLIQNETTFTLAVAPLNDPANAKKGTCSATFREVLNPEKDGQITRTLSPEEMKADLEIFRKIREKANSGFYRYRTKQQIDSIYEWANKQVKEPLGIIEFDKIVMTLTDFEGSNHNNTRLPYHPADYIPKDKGYFPFFFKNIDGQMIVNYAGSEIPLGSQVLSINGITDKELRKRFFKYCTTDGYNQTAKDKASIERSFGWNYPFEMGISDQFEITYKKPGSEQIERITLPGISRTENSKRYYERHSAKLDSLTDYDFQEKYSCKTLDPQTVLLNLRIFTMASNSDDPAFGSFSNYLDSLFRAMNQTGVKNLIIDIRNNPGGNDPNYEKVFTYLTDHPFRENTGAYILFRKLPYPEYYNWNSSDKRNQKRELKDLNSYFSTTYSVKRNSFYYQDSQFNPVYLPDSNRFQGRVYLLINEDVGSAASHFASLVRGHSQAIIVGTETSGGYYGHNGHFPVEYKLPNSGIVTRFSIVHVTQDAPEKATQPPGRGIIPDYQVGQSLEDFLQNEDTPLKWVLQLIEKEKK